MPIAAGVMQSAKVTVTNTITTIDSALPSLSGASCGQDIEFNFSVYSTNPLYIVDDGYVTIIDLNTNTELGGGNVIAGVGTTGLISGLSGLLNIVAKYSGTYNQFGTSISSELIYPITRQETQITINSPTIEEIHCYYSPINVEVNLEGAVEGIPSGDIYLNVYFDDDNYMQFGPAAIDPITGNATVEIPAETGNLDGYSRYLQVTYAGDSCFAPAGTQSGTSGYEIVVVVSDDLSIVLDSFPGTYPISDPVTLTANIYTDVLPLPDGYDGYVQFSYTSPYDISYTLLGTSYMNEGIATFTVPGDTFPSTGTWEIMAEFFSDNPCYGSNILQDSKAIEIVY